VTNDLGNTGTGGAQSDTDTINITVNSLNDAPSFTIAGDPPAVTVDSGPQTVNSFATGISQGPGESGQTPLTFNVVAQGGATVNFSSAPAIDATTGNLTYTASAGDTGTATFDVTLTDSGPTGGGNVNTSGVQTFTITVLPNLALTVNNNGDAADNNLGDRICDSDLAAGLQCTLRAAIQETNAASTADTIGFDPSLNGGSITLLTALDSITDDLAINGPGANLLTVQRSSAGGTPEFIVFQTGVGTIVSISGLTISNGRSGNTTFGAGIAIGGGGTLNLSFSTISGNTAGAGSGVYNEDGTLTVTNSTFSGNSTLTGGFSGAAIHTTSGTTNIVNSTFSGNSSAQSGGAISVGTGIANITNATITNNRADSDGNASGTGGGIANLSSGTVTLKNTIVFGNFVGVSTTADDIAGNVVAGSNNNLIGTGGSGGLTGGVNNNQVGVVDARLGVLAFNGGPTQTHALLARSVALDAGDDSVTLAPLSLTTDQRGAGFARQVDSADAGVVATVDIGAFEAGLKISGPGLYFNNSTVFLRNLPSPGSADFAFMFGSSSVNDYLAISGDWNKDGRDTIGLYDEATGNFFLTDTNGAGPATATFQFGAGNLGYIPISGDWDGDSFDTIGLYDPATGTFFLRNSNTAGAADIVFTFGAGNPNIVPLTGDWDGDGDDTIGIYDSTTGIFFLRNSNTPGPADLTFQFGVGGTAIPVMGDWNGDGTITVGIYIPSTGAFFLRNTNTAGPADVTPFTFTTGGGRPVAGDWAP
jgi:predicted outer membrane repeat protein